MEPLKITAKINSFMASDPWSPSIDSILAYWHLFEKLSSEEFHLTASRQDTLVQIDDLPLAKFDWKNGMWWWECSSPFYAVRQEHVKYIHRRFDNHEAESYMKPKRGNIQTKAGPYKNFRGAFKQIITDRIDWYVIGDKSKIKRLLQRCTNVGAKLAAGHGLVKEWIIEEDEEAVERCMMRPVPIEYADENKLEYSSILEWAYKPPFRLEENKTLCAMP